MQRQPEWEAEVGPNLQLKSTTVRNNYLDRDTEAQLRKEERLAINTLPDRRRPELYLPMPPREAAKLCGIALQVTHDNGDQASESACMQKLHSAVSSLP